MDLAMDVGDKASALTWLQAAERVLLEEGPEMHIKDLTSRIMELGIVKSSCTTSLETLLYRHTSKGYSKFVRVPGKMGCFALNEHVIREHSNMQPLEDDLIMPSSVPSAGNAEPGRKMVEGGGGGGGGDDAIPESEERGGGFVGFEPRVFYRRKRRHSYQCSESGGSSASEGGDGEGEEEEEGEGEGDVSSSESSSEGGEEAEYNYRKKYSFVKKIAKSIVHENAALSCQLELLERKIKRAEEEKRYLMDKLTARKQESQVKREQNAPADVKKPAVVTPKLPEPARASVLVSTHSKKTKPPSVQVVPPNGSGPPDLVPTLISHNGTLALQIGNISALLSAPSLSPGLTGLKQANLVGKGLTTTTTTTAVAASLVKGSVAVRNKQKPPVTVKQPRFDAGQASSSDSDDWSDHNGDTKPGVRSPAGGVATSSSVSGVKRSPQVKPTTSKDDAGSRAKKGGKLRRVYPIPHHEDGSPIFPIQIGGLKVHHLGKIVVDRVSYHSERYILPVGFESSREYPSMRDPSHKCSYTCRILDGGDHPLFEMVADDDPTNPIRATSSTACQTIVLKAINKAREKQATNSGSGPEFFGYANPTILNLIQSMSAAKQLYKYKPVAFEEATGKGVGGATGVKRSNRGKSSEKVKKEVKVAATSGSSPMAGLMPVLGSSGIIGMETNAASYSSSYEWSSESEAELVIDG